MSGAFWAGDSLAQSIEAAGARARANFTLALQQQYHSQDAVLKRAALVELERVDPSNPMLREDVRERMSALAAKSFRGQGWERTCSLTIDPREVAAQLKKERLAAIDEAIQAAEKEQVIEKRKGWIFARRTVYRWAETEHSEPGAAHAAKAAELARLRGKSVCE